MEIVLEPQSSSTTRHRVPHPPFPHLLHIHLKRKHKIKFDDQQKLILRHVMFDLYCRVPSGSPTTASSTALHRVSFVTFCHVDITQYNIFLVNVSDHQCAQGACMCGYEWAR